MELLYKSTRSADKTVTASYAILKGLAEDGGLFVPTSFPKLDVSIDRLADMSYQEVAYEVMKLFLTDFTEEELKHCINSAYDQKFDTEVIAPLVKADDAYYLELFHGKTIAFKDMALSILPYLMTEGGASDASILFIMLTDHRRHCCMSADYFFFCDIDVEFQTALLCRYTESAHNGIIRQGRKRHPQQLRCAD